MVNVADAVKHHLISRKENALAVVSERQVKETISTQISLENNKKSFLGS